MIQMIQKVHGYNWRLNDRNTICFVSVPFLNQHSNHILQNWFMWQLAQIQHSFNKYFNFQEFYHSNLIAHKIEHSHSAMD